MTEIAVVAAAARFPGARDIDTFWTNLRDGVDGIVHFTLDELIAAGVPEREVKEPGYVPARGYLAGADLFDAALFGYSLRDAALIDPQQRLLLECAHEALDLSGHGSRPGERVGVYVGARVSTYLMAMLADPGLAGRLDPVAIISGERDVAATRLAYKLGLRGPALTVQTACSTSLVAVHLAVSALRLGECDAAIAGAAAVSVPLKSGYRYEEGGPYAPDGRTRSFDASAAGTVPGNGVGLVVLRRLADALADGDDILAVIRGTAVNNDGAGKVGFTAPSVQGQAEVITAALRAAGTPPETISYVEAHGTATPMGDPIEVAALTEAFRGLGDPRTGGCAIGSVKSNLGHLDTAAGVAGLIKTALALKHGELPPTLHFERPNPLLELDRTPFFVGDSLRAWDRNGGPRRAGVSSFGIGGTNVHVVLEEPPAVPRPAPEAGSPEQLVVVSAHTAAALRRMVADLLGDRDRAEPRIVDVAATSAAARSRHAYRWYTVARDGDDITGLEVEPKRPGPARPLTVFVFPGVGAHYRGMGRRLYETEPVFRDAIDACGPDVAALLYGDAAADLGRPWHACQVTFAVEHALSALLASWGIEPDAVIGNSTGEYAAACVAGVMSPAGTLELLRRRVELVERTGGGTMLAAALAPDQLTPLLTDGVVIAAINAPEACLLAGASGDVARTQANLERRGVDFRAIPVDAAGHSPVLDPILPDFLDIVRAADLRAPRLPIVSNVTGDWLAPERATDPEYWVRQLRSTVRLADGLRVACAGADAAWVVGPGRSYARWLRQSGLPAEALLVSCLPPRQRAGEDRRELLRGLGAHWAGGGEVRWDAVYGPHGPRRVRLPRYPYQPRRHWALGGGTPDREAEPGIADFVTDATATPESGAERALAAIWAEMFGIARIGRHDDFFELGGDSMLALRMARRIRAEFAGGVEPKTILNNPTIAGLAGALGDRPAAGRPDLAEAARAAVRGLPERITQPAQVAEPRVLLTGATGYLGPYLLAELLARQDLPVSVLVRAANADVAAERVRRRMMECSLWEPAFAARITAVAGDLGAEGLGLSPAERRELGKATAIYHAGASVNFLLDYERLASVNVSGTREVLRLAAESGAHVHHVSTLGVAFGGPAGEVIGEDPLGDEPGALPTGYVQSKWVAERLVTAARERGFPASIYRVGLVLGDSMTGRCNRSDLFWRFIHTCAMIGIAPERTGEIYAGGVDQIAALLVGLSRLPSRPLLHVTGLPLPWSRIWDWLGELDRPVETIGHAAWIDAVRRRVADGEPLPLAPFAGMLPELVPAEATPTITGESHALALEHGLRLPALDLESLERSLWHIEEQTS